jgi:hypothetical protein
MRAVLINPSKEYIQLVNEFINNDCCNLNNYEGSFHFTEADYFKYVLVKEFSEWLRNHKNIRIRILLNYNLSYVVRVFDSFSIMILKD